MKIILEKGQNVYFTSDTHYGQRNICRGVSDWKSGHRDFDTIDEMNSAIVDNINKIVKTDDILFHDGDWSFGGFDKIKELRDRINCKNIYLFLGNHDHHILNNNENIRDLFTNVDTYCLVRISEKPERKGGMFTNTDIVFCHYPIQSWQNKRRGVIHLHGHCHTPHEHKIGMGRKMDIGIDGHPEFRPYSLDEIKELVSEREIFPKIDENFSQHIKDTLYR